MSISRRQLMAAAGAGWFGLQLRSAHAAPLASPKRFVAIYQPNGCFSSQWFPSGGETGFTLGQSHAALEPYRQHCLWLQGVNLKVAVNGEGEQHQRGIGAFLTGQGLQTGSFVGNDGTTAGWAKGASLDQLLVPVVGKGAIADSLQLGVHCIERDVSGVISYAGAAQPLLAENDPSRVFSRLFGQLPGPPDEKEKLRRRRASVLDTVKKQFPQAKRGLALADQQRLDEHFTQLRDLEARVAGVPSNPSCPPPDAPPTTMFATESAMGEVARLQLDLLVKALQCDLTRVATLAFSDAKNHIGLPFIGINSDVHNISHLSDTDMGRAQLGLRDRWMAEQFAYLVRRLAETPDGSGTLLDSTMVLWGSELGEGNTHSHVNTPCVLAGYGAGFRMGRYVKAGGASWNDMLLSVFRGLGGSGEKFGDPAFCDGPLAGLI